MKITILISSGTGGGAERVACSLANYLSRRNAVTLLMITDAGRTYPLLPAVRQLTLKQPLTDCRGPREKAAALLSAWKKLCRFVREDDTERYVTFLPPACILIGLLRRRIRVPVIFCERCAPSFYPRWQQLLLRTAASRADGLVFQTEEIRDWYAPHPPQRSVLIPNAVTAAAPSEAAPHPGRTILGVGRLNRQKRFDLLLQAFSRIHNRFPDCSLELCGTGPEEQNLRALAHSLELQDAVNFCGFTEDLSGKYRTADVFVLSSDYEGIPNALLEAMAAGLPCVATDCAGGGPRSLIRSGENGFLVRPGDPDALAEAIAQVLENPETAAARGRRAAETVETFTPETIYGKWETFLLSDFRHA